VAVPPLLKFTEVSQRPREIPPEVWFVSIDHGRAIYLQYQRLCAQLAPGSLPLRESKSQFSVYSEAISVESLDQRSRLPTQHRSLTAWHTF